MHLWVQTENHYKIEIELPVIRWVWVATLAIFETNEALRAKKTRKIQ